MNFNELLEKNCFGETAEIKEKAARDLELYYNCEIFAVEMDRSVHFAHNGRGCTIIVAKICKDVVIYQNVTIGSNMKYNKRTKEWENLGNPILSKNVIVADGAKILGPVIIGKNTLVAAGAIITKDIPANSIAFGVNQYKPKNPNFELVYYKKLPKEEDITKANEKLLENFKKVNNKK